MVAVVAVVLAPVVALVEEGRKVLVLAVVTVEDILQQKDIAVEVAVDGAIAVVVLLQVVVQALGMLVDKD